jgi:hypothetical protein
MVETTGEFVQLNRINKFTLPGPSFAPGVTKDGGMFKYRVKDWYKYEDTPEPEDNWSRRQVNIEPPSFINKTLWPQNVPAYYPYRKIEYDEGVTLALKEKTNTNSFIYGQGSKDVTFWAVIGGFVLIALIISKSK